jgi:hypothetical protein
VRTIPVLQLCGLAFWLVQAQPAINFSPSELKYKVIDCEGDSCPCDAVVATLRQRDGQFLTWIGGAWQTRKTRGPIDDPFRQMIYQRLNTQVFTMDSSVNRTAAYAAHATNYANFYLKNVYDIDGKGRLLGFLHVENLKALDANHMPTYPAIYTIGLCYSEDWGDHWWFCGDIIGVNDKNCSDERHCGKSGPPWNFVGVACNIGGCPYLLVGDYLYVYFNEKQNAESTYPYPAVARAKLSDVVTAARAHTVVSWKKYNGGSWDQDGMTGLGSQILPEGGDMHTDAAYCTALHKYLLMSNVGEEIFIHTSVDGVHWSDRHLVTKTPTPGLNIAYPWFISTADGATSDCRVVGKDFYIYYQVLVVDPTHGDIPLYLVKANVVDNNSVGPLLPHTR